MTTLEITLIIIGVVFLIGSFMVNDKLSHKDLDKIADAVNEANCKTTVTADNGETFDTYMNKFSSDMIGMITEATLNKQNSNSLTLN